MNVSGPLLSSVFKGAFQHLVRERTRVLQRMPATRRVASGQCRDRVGIPVDLPEQGDDGGIDPVRSHRPRRLLSVTFPGKGQRKNDGLVPQLIMPGNRPAFARCSGGPGQDSVVERCIPEPDRLSGTVRATW